MTREKKHLDVYCADLEHCTMKECHEAAARRRQGVLFIEEPPPILQPAMQCWHCSGTGRCSCMFCDGRSCTACIGRKRVEKELDLAERLGLDVRNVASYELGHTGLHYYRRFRFPAGVTA